MMVRSKLNGFATLKNPPWLGRSLCMLVPMVKKYHRHNNPVSYTGHPVWCLASHVCRKSILCTVVSHFEKLGIMHIKL